MDLPTDRTLDATPLSPTIAHVIDEGTARLLADLPDRLGLDEAAATGLRDALSIAAMEGWRCQRSGSGASTAVDTDELSAATRKLFDQSAIDGLSAGLGQVQRDSVYRAIPLAGLGSAPDANTLIVTQAAGGTAIIETLGALNAVLTQDEPARWVFTAATDAVMWGAAMAIAERSLSPSFDPASPHSAHEVSERPRSPIARILDRLPGAISLAVIGLVIAAVGGLMLRSANSHQASYDDFQACVASGHPVCFMGDDGSRSGGSVDAFRDNFENQFTVSTVALAIGGVLVVLAGLKWVTTRPSGSH